MRQFHLFLTNLSSTVTFRCLPFKYLLNRVTVLQNILTLCTDNDKQDSERKWDFFDKAHFFTIWLMLSHIKNNSNSLFVPFHFNYTILCISYGEAFLLLFFFFLPLSNIWTSSLITLIYNRLLCSRLTSKTTTSFGWQLFQINKFLYLKQLKFFQTG